MKNIFTVFIILFVSLLCACKKENSSALQLSSINLVNATVNVSAVKASFLFDVNSPNYFNLITAITAYGSNTSYSLPSNVSVPLTIASASDSTKFLFKNPINFPSGSIFTLYLAGQSTSVDTILVKENIPSYTDSICGVRFVNLSYNNSPIIVTLATSSTVNDFNSLSYKSISGFKTYPAVASVSSYTFQIRDAGSNAILATYVYTPARMLNCTLAFIGQAGGSGANAQRVIRINNY